MKSSHKSSDLTSYKEIEMQQRAFCRERGVNYVPAPPESKLGFAIQSQGLIPINGERSQQEDGTNVWMIWCGEELSTAADFFVSLHTVHLVERCPEALKFLGLPPGYRFLVAGDYLDIWYDSSLLDL